MKKVSQNLILEIDLGGGGSKTESNLMFDAIPNDNFEPLCCKTVSSWKKKRLHIFFPFSVILIYSCVTWDQSYK